MEKAKHALSSVMSSREEGHTRERNEQGVGDVQRTVDKDMRKPVTHEVVRPQEHEEVTPVINREIHREEHQTKIQPIKARETLPEQHARKVLPVEDRSFVHGNKSETRGTLERDAAGYKDTSDTRETQHSTSMAPAVPGREEVHRHVHEHIQPVIQKETVAPRVVHAAAPVHETHYQEPVFRDTTVLPAKTQGEFERDIRNNTRQG